MARGKALKELSDSDLIVALNDSKEEVKKNVARAMTELREREIAAAEELEENDD